MINDNLKRVGKLSIAINDTIVQEVDNLVVTSGKVWVAQRMNNVNTVMTHQAIGTGTATAGAGRFGHGVAGRTTFGVALVCGLVGVAPTQQRLAIDGEPKHSSISAISSNNCSGIVRWQIIVYLGYLGRLYTGRDETCGILQLQI